MQKVINLGRLVLSIGWAKSGLWTSTDSKILPETKTHLITVRIISRGGSTALSVIVLPVLLMIGWVSK